MSDEFNTAGSSFEPGDDHLWTSIDKADSVNSALEIYMHNMTGTQCNGDDCYFYIEADTGETAAMVQSWNKFCFQGGMIEVRAQLPGASPTRRQSDVKTGSGSVRASSIDYYPTWPGIWMMGNLGRAIFSASTAPRATMIRGMGERESRSRAPEIDILEGGGTAISSSVQVGPGMPEDFRLIADAESSYCFYTYDCATEGANSIDVPKAYYENLRGHKSCIRASCGNNDTSCTASSGSTDASSEFAYQMDAISSNWEIQVSAYTDWLTYQLEWVMGDDGYIRWMLAGEPLFEITADVLTNPPQDAAQMNPKKIMLENHYMGLKASNAGDGGCYGNGSDATTNAICDAFPMYLKVDYVRVYQDKSSDSSMAIAATLQRIPPDSGLKTTSTRTPHHAVSVYLSYLAARKSDELLLKEIMAKKGPQSSASWKL
ncbi:hypothetical protein PInf_024596 [Phytophthora infestans]|nr:hypothetical protein PInf_024596 [Phytophthora infestans]